MEEIRRIARGRGIEPGRMGKSELIRRIQFDEGYITCFGSAGSECRQRDCRWRRDCRIYSIRLVDGLLRCAATED